MLSTGHQKVMDATVGHWELFSSSAEIVVLWTLVTIVSVDVSSLVLVSTQSGWCGKEA